MKSADLQHKKELLKAIINSQEHERKRIGMDLHDDVGSKLSSLRFMIESFFDQNKELLTNTEFLLQCKKSIDDVIQNVRNISHNLSPVLKGAHDFSDAICDFCQEINKSGKIKIRLVMQIGDSHFPTFTKLCLFRVITELINNTIKHASAKHVFLSFSMKNEKCRIVYADDGVGFPSDDHLIKKGIGLKNIESRLESIDASFLIKSATGKGFYMIIRVPVIN